MRTSALFPAVVACSVSVMLGGCFASATSNEEEDVHANASSEAAFRSRVSYFRVLRRDVRRCASPMCGGFVVQRVNDEQTAGSGCVGEPFDTGTCYVSNIDLRALDLTPREESDLQIAMENGLVLVKGALVHITPPGDRAIAALRASAVWLGVTGSPPKGTFVSITRDPAPCMRAICPIYVASSLGSPDTRTGLVEVVLDRTVLRAEKHELAIAKETLDGHSEKEDSIKVVGTLNYDCEDQACLPSFVASEVYAPVIRREGKDCFSWHTFDCNENQYCSYAPASICGAANALGVCAYPAERCSTIYKPVCGCDGKTYGNSCEAASVGVSVAIEDACTDAEKVAPPAPNDANATQPGAP